MGKETKIGLVVVAALVLFFGVVVWQKLRPVSAEKPPAAPKQTAQAKPGSSEKPSLGAATGKQQRDDEALVIVEPRGTDGSFGRHEGNRSAGSFADSDEETEEDENTDASAAGPGMPGTGAAEDDAFSSSTSHPALQRSVTLGPSLSRSQPSEPASREDEPDHLHDGAETDSDEEGSSALAENSGQVAKARGEGWSAASGARSSRSSGGKSATSLASDARSGMRKDGLRYSTEAEDEKEDAEPEAPNSSLAIAAPQGARRTDGAASSLVQPRGDQDAERWVIQAGDTFWTISVRRYGAGRYFRALARWNEKAVPDATLMRLGMVVETPRAEVLERTYPELVEAAPSSSAVAVMPGAPKKAGTFADASGEKFYRVGTSDTLFDISRKTLGRGSRWKEIFELNRDTLSRPDRLSPGMILRLPTTAVVRDMPAAPTRLR